MAFLRNFLRIFDSRSNPRPQRVRAHDRQRPRGGWTFVHNYRRNIPRRPR